jgi:hypothetical protein
MGFQGAKVFSATKAKEREGLGERVTEWIRRTGAVCHTTEMVVLQSSDMEYHCLSIVVFYEQPHGSIHRAGAGELRSHEPIAGGLEPSQGSIHRDESPPRRVVP